MDIGSLSGLIPSNKNQTSISKSNERLQAAVASLVSGSNATQASDNVATVALASLLQSDISSLRQAGGNIAQASSLAEVADGGAEQIGNIVLRLREIATQSNSGALSDPARKSMNEEFQSLTKEVDRIAGNTQFGGRKLLNGDVSGNGAISLDGLQVIDGTEGDSLTTLSINDLSSSSLFGGAHLDVLSQAGAQNALSALGSAISQISGARLGIGSFQQATNFASANLESAVFNQEAARSTLADTDFAAASTELSLALLQQNASIAAAAQGNRLAPALLKLIA